MTRMTVENLKVLRQAISKMPLDQMVLDTIEKLDLELADHGLKAIWVPAPRVKYQKKSVGSYQFENLKK